MLYIIDINQKYNFTYLSKNSKVTRYTYKQPQHNSQSQNTNIFQLQKLKI